MNTTCPGFIDSPRFDRIGNQREAIRDHIVRTTPLKAAVTPEEVAPTALFLGSSAARHTTGETVLVDAGLPWHFALKPAAA